MSLLEFSENCDLDIQSGNCTLCVKLKCAVGLESFFSVFSFFF